MIEMTHESPQVQNLLLASWAPKTQASYNTYIKKWLPYCQENNISDPYQATYSDAINFLSYLFHEGKYQYGSIAAARSALSAILPKQDGKTFGEHPTVSKLLKGIYKLRPSLPKYTVIYDPDIVLSYIATLPKNSELLLELLTKKLVTLLCLLSGQRAQSIEALHLNYSSLSNGKYIFYIPSVLKTSKPGRHQAPLEFESFPDNENLCIVNCIQEYISRTKLIRENLEGQPTKLILSYAYPHQPVGSATIAQYVKTFLGMAGVDLTVFTAHSTRSASSSKANNIGLSIKDIQKAAGWTNDSTFRRFYNLPIKRNFGSAIIHAYTDSATN